MITHIVLFKLKDRSAESVEKARDVLLGMKGKIPQLKYIETGMDIVRSDRSYDIALITKFDSLEELISYQAHPVHMKVAAYINSVKESSVSVDFESRPE